MIVSRQSVQRAAPDRTEEPTRILALDYGRTRIGLALADHEARLARPLTTLARKNRNEDLRRLRGIVREHGVARIVVGLPLRLDGTRGEMAEEAERFAGRLRKHLSLPVELMDERLTSWEAEALLREKKKISHRDAESTKKSRRKNRKENSVDAAAAAVILREYLTQRNRKEQD